MQPALRQSAPNLIGDDMATLDRARMFPMAVMETFEASWPGFKELPAEERRHLTHLLCSAFRHGKYAHSVYADAISYGYATRDEQFGRGRFQTINAKLKLFEIEEHWQVGQFTKGYRLTPEALFLLESVPLRTTQLVDTKGMTMQTIAMNAILERDFKGNHRRGRGQLSAIQAVKIENLIALLAEARQWRWCLKDHGTPPKDRRLEKRLFEMADDRQRIDWLSNYLIVPASLLVLRADTPLLPKGSMEIQYCESQAGRLYSVAGIMQTVPREVRNAAFEGSFDLDIENCHYSLISQMAERLNLPTPEITNYILNKSEIRRMISEDVGITISQVKSALISVVYGSTKRTNSYFKGNHEVQPAIVRLMGIDKAAELFAHPNYLALHQEVKRIRKPILAAAPKNRKMIVNEFGKGLSLDESPEAQLAHIVQGAEALALDSVLQHYGPRIQLCMHDGWVADHEMNIQEVSTMIFQQTGYRVALEQKRIF